MIDGPTNCVVFIADATRWDYTPESLLDRGTSFKTVAASIDTSTSIPSMLTGYNPQQHGVFSFNHRLSDDIDSLIDLDGYECGFYNAAGPDDGLNSVLNESTMRSLDDLTEPFIYVERGHGGHHPYQVLGDDKDIETFRREFAGDEERTRETYAKAIDASIGRFEDRLQALVDRGILDDTLVIFTSDHGELLGESGWMGHLTPTFPEVVYVPTIFIYPDIKFDEKPDFIGHVDIFPTVLEMLGETTPNDRTGVDVFSTATIRKRYNYAIKGIEYNQRFFYYYKASSAWDGDGGHIFNRTSIPGKLFFTAYLLGGNKWMAKHLRREFRKYPDAWSSIFNNYRRVGDPDISRVEADSYVQEIEQETTESETVELDADIEKRLKQLGYK